MGELHKEHGHDCACGCRGHEHGHASGHDHHDHHDHDHEHADVRKRSVSLGWADVDLESHVHDQASTVSATIHARSDSGRSFGDIVEALQVVAQKVEEQGAIVGHIKAYARTADSFSHASTTDAQRMPSSEGDLQMALGPDVQCQLVVIALLVDLDVLEQIAIAALG